MKRSCPIIAKHEEQRLKTWWIATGISIVVVIILLWLLTFRINRIIRTYANEHHNTPVHQMSSKASIPCATMIIQEISRTLPARVAFQKISIDPACIKIEGKTQDPHAWSSWLESVEKLPWIAKIDIEHLTNKKQYSQDYSFLINLYF